jgi:hypothetical protein
MNKSYVYVPLFLFLMVGCTKDNGIINETGIQSTRGDTLTSMATVTWEGAYEVDGCGFFIHIDNKEYKPVDEGILSDEFKNSRDPIEVKIEYINLNKKQSYYCGDLPYTLYFDVIEILTIEKL